MYIDAEERKKELMSQNEMNGLMFKIDDGEITPVKHPDPICTDDLFCYEMQRDKVINNTKSFLAGKPAADVFLYGDAGTGKSSTVKALVFVAR